MRTFKYFVSCLVFMLSISFTFPSYAAQNEGIISCHEEQLASPRVLLTLTDYVWDNSGAVEFRVRYVVDDANFIIVEVLEATISDKASGVSNLSKPVVNLASNGSYATVKCNYDYETMSGVVRRTALVEIHP